MFNTGHQKMNALKYKHTSKNIYRDIMLSKNTPQKNHILSLFAERIKILLLPVSLSLAKLFIIFSFSGIA